MIRWSDAYHFFAAGRIKAAWQDTSGNLWIERLDGSVFCEENPDCDYTLEDRIDRRDVFDLFGKTITPPEHSGSGGAQVLSPKG